MSDYLIGYLPQYIMSYAESECEFSYALRVDKRYEATRDLDGDGKMEVAVRGTQEVIPNNALADKQVRVFIGTKNESTTTCKDLVGLANDYYKGKSRLLILKNFAK